MEDDDDTNKFEECVPVLSEKIKWLKRHDFSDETQFKIDNFAENLVPDRAKKVLYVFNVLSQYSHVSVHIIMIIYLIYNHFSNSVRTQPARAKRRFKIS